MTYKKYEIGDTVMVTGFALIYDMQNSKEVSMYSALIPPFESTVTEAGFRGNSPMVYLKALVNGFGKSIGWVSAKYIIPCNKPCESCESRFKCLTT